MKTAVKYGVLVQNFVEPQWDCAIRHVFHTCMCVVTVDRGLSLIAFCV